MPKHKSDEFTGAIYIADSSGNFRLKKESTFHRISVPGEIARIYRPEPVHTASEKGTDLDMEIREGIKKALEESGFCISDQ